jgi:uncharacterized protein YbbK (DUF523 family)
LLGDPVRYDGQHKRSTAVADDLAAHVEWVRLCPEVEVGMGVPRESVGLVGSGDATRLVGVSSGHDWTPAFDEWANACIAGLPGDLCGWVFKSRSPSCGLDVREARALGPESRGLGLFARALVRAMPRLPVIEEQALEAPAARATFLERARAFGAG